MGRTNLVYANPVRDPGFAALLSLLPGLGQFYNGENRKGLLFLDVALFNYLLLALVTLAPVIAKSLREFGLQYGLKVNHAVLGLLSQLQIGSPASLIIFGLVIAFVCYAVRDAYDRAILLKRRAIYSDSVIELNEAASGSYLIHASIVGALAVIALFFLMPKPLSKQIVEIQFINTIQTNTRVKPKTDVRAVQNNKAKTRNFEKERPIQRVPPKSEISKTDKQMEKSAANSASIPASASSASSVSSASSGALSSPASSAPSSSVSASAPASASASSALALASVATRAASLSSASSSLKPPVPYLPVRSQLRPVLPTLVSLQGPVGSSQQLNVLPKTIAVSSFVPLPSSSQSNADNKKLSALPSVIPSNGFPQSKSRGTESSIMPAERRGNGSEMLDLSNLKESSQEFFQGSGGKSFAPKMPTGTSGIRDFANVSGPVHNPVAVGSGRKTGVVPMTLGSDPSGKDGKSEASQGIPKPVRGLGARGNSPIRIIPQVGSPISGTGDKPINIVGPLGDETPSTLKDVDFTRYMADLQRRIKKQWFPPKDMQSRRVKVMFKIHSSGSLSNLRLVEGTGYPLADQAALTAVQNASPFMSLPNGAPDNVDIEFTFDYNVFLGK